MGGGEIRCGSIRGQHRCMGVAEHQGYHWCWDKKGGDRPWLWLNVHSLAEGRIVEVKAVEEK